MKRFIFISKKRFDKRGIIEDVLDLVVISILVFLLFIFAGIFLSSLTSAKKDFVKENLLQIKGEVEINSLLAEKSFKEALLKKEKDKIKEFLDLKFPDLSYYVLIAFPDEELVFKHGEISAKDLKEKVLFLNNQLVKIKFKFTPYKPRILK